MNLTNTTFTGGNEPMVYISQGGAGSTFDISLTDSNLSGTHGGIVNTVAGLTVNAQGNWWGDPDGPGGTDVSGNVDTGNYSDHVILPDNDLDGLKNWEEDTNLNGVVDAGETDPNNPDTDGDGFSDGYEVLTLFSDPLDPLDPYDPSNPDPNYVDNDMDGLPAINDPNDNNPDTDGDGYPDGYEVQCGTDPTNPNDKPKLGDVNNNGRVDNVDAIIIFQAQLGAIDINRYIDKTPQMDLNRDGLVNYQDAVYAFDFFLGIRNKLPVQ